MNKKRFAFAAIAAFVAIFVTDFLIHNVMLSEHYAASMQLWRPMEEMNAVFPIMLLAQLLIGIALAWIFTYGYQNKGIMEGVRFGALIGILNIANTLVWYVVIPLPTGLMWAWLITGFIQSIVIGVVISLVYKKK